MIKKLAAEVAGNINAVLALGGFVSVEWGILAQWSTPLAAIVGGVVLMSAGVWPYVRSKGKP